MSGDAKKHEQCDSKSRRAKKHEQCDSKSQKAWSLVQTSTGTVSGQYVLNCLMETYLGTAREAAPLRNEKTP